ncbi:PhzF family phenazine biosynthesis protein [Arenimonas donghaensis]|uniref:Phenazine biosynthesis protein PhzF n=1 Tax=Arenimonas donghaensis DSM 18148 = HO3-R19 TaxID=1121014 RepID=A0A087MFE5_9GAMM|nr:PhzF family phenazine biosynthesis isomerase [Arenimonas donghaensis]KFL35598.1 hypothetical protein N788_07640 [Arenimonas donghaensis DSM 18148 = HO3-R19]
MNTEILHYSAFTNDPAGGNQAGIVLDARDLSDAAMQAIAADLAYSESVFLSPRSDGDFDVRYFSPKAEVSFCGHATIAATVALADRQGPGEWDLHTVSGRVRVSVDARRQATLVSVAPRVEPIADADLEALLALLGWQARDLDPSLLPAVAYAGAWHPVLVATSRDRLADLAYDFDALAALMARRQWTTVSLVWRETPASLHARNPFPPGGVVEDAATGAAAAALGAYLASRDALPPSREFTIRQGEDMGRPSRLHVHVPPNPAEGIRVSGSAVELPAPERPGLRA